VEGVADDPAPEAFAWELAGSTVNVRVRWWTQSKRSEMVHTQGWVIRAVKLALTQEGIDLPFPPMWFSCTIRRRRRTATAVASGTTGRQERTHRLLGTLMRW
jgi:small-conductance mechanosensitive channel